VICLSPSGNEEWIYRYDGPSHGSDEIRSVTLGSDGNLYAVGASEVNGCLTGYDVLVISLELPPVGVKEEEDSDSKSSFLVPTFFQDRIVMQNSQLSEEPLNISLYSVSGRQVLYKSFPSNTHSLILQEEIIEDLASGIYFLRLSTREFSKTYKILKFKGLN